MNVSGSKVIIVGAGIGGATAALAFAQRGAHVKICEQASAASDVGGGLQLGPNSVKVLDALGLGKKLRSIATFPQAGYFRDYKRGRSIAHLTFGAEAEARFGAPYLQFHRADLLDLLLKAAEQAGVTVTFNHRVEAVDQLDADIIVAADGIKSALRSFVAGPSEPRFTKQVAWRGQVEASRLPADLFPQAATIFFGPHRHLITYPLRNAKFWNVVAVEERSEWTPEDWRATADPSDVQNAFSGWCDPIGQLLGALDETYLWGLFDHPPLPVWHKDNVALLGDACHAMLPFLAQGAAMAIEDAYVLAACCDQSPVEQALPRYQDLRKARATRVQATAAGNGKIYHNPTPVLRHALQLGIALSARKKGGLLARYDWLYGEDVTRP